MIFLCHVDLGAVRWHKDFRKFKNMIEILPHACHNAAAKFDAGWTAGSAPLGSVVVMVMRAFDNFGGSYYDHRPDFVQSFTISAFEML